MDRLPSQENPDWWGVLLGAIPVLAALAAFSGVYFLVESWRSPASSVMSPSAVKEFSHDVVLSCCAAHEAGTLGEFARDVAFFASKEDCEKAAPMFPKGVCTTMSDFVGASRDPRGPNGK